MQLHTGGNHQRTSNMFVIIVFDIIVVESIAEPTLVSINSNFKFKSFNLATDLVACEQKCPVQLEGTSQATKLVKHESRPPAGFPFYSRLN